MFRLGILGRGPRGLGNDCRVCCKLLGCTCRCCIDCNPLCILFWVKLCCILLWMEFCNVCVTLFCMLGWSELGCNVFCRLLCTWRVFERLFAFSWDILKVSFLCWINSYLNLKCGNQREENKRYIELIIFLSIGVRVRKVAGGENVFVAAKSKLIITRSYKRNVIILFTGKIPDWPFSEDNVHVKVSWSLIVFLL